MRLQAHRQRIFHVIAECRSTVPGQSQFGLCGLRPLARHLRQWLRMVREHTMMTSDSILRDRSFGGAILSGALGLLRGHYPKSFEMLVVPDLSDAIRCKHSICQSWRKALFSPFRISSCDRFGVSPRLELLSMHSGPAGAPSCNARCLVFLACCLYFFPILSFPVCPCPGFPSRCSLSPGLLFGFPLIRHRFEVHPCRARRRFTCVCPSLVVRRTGSTGGRWRFGVGVEVRLESISWVPTLLSWVQASCYAALQHWIDKFPCGALQGAH